MCPMTERAPASPTYGGCHVVLIVEIRDLKEPIHGTAGYHIYFQLHVIFFGNSIWAEDKIDRGNLTTSTITMSWNGMSRMYKNAASLKISDGKVALQLKK